MGLFRRQRLGIDLGSSNIVIYIEHKGIALKEPAIVAVQKDTQQVVAFGREAEQLIGRTSENYDIIRPIQRGVIAHLTLAEKMLSHFMQQAIRKTIAKPEVVVCVPSTLSKVEKKAVVDLLKKIGTLRAMLLEEVFATAIGANLAVHEPRGRFVINIGGGTTDLALLSYGEMVAHNTVLTSGSTMDQLIVDYVREHYHIAISTEIAESIKLAIGNAKYTSHDANDDIVIKGVNIVTQKMEEKTIHASIVAKALDEEIAQIVWAIRQLLSQAPPEMAADIAENGIILAGGTALLKRLPERLHDEIQIPVHLVANPMDCVVLGAGKMLKAMDEKTKLLEKKRR
ncbi:MAG: rod shape-determining protein [Aerococcaceae bacterium]|nr:rod shape-determining protein [Aerococcaceae bacterium]